MQEQEKQTQAEWDKRCVAEATAGLLLERQHGEEEERTAEAAGRGSRTDNWPWSRKQGGRGCLVNGIEEIPNMHNMCQCIFCVEIMVLSVGSRYASYVVLHSPLLPSILIKF